MSKVNIANVVILNNPASFFDPFKFEITFECYEKISDDLEFKLIYVGSAESQEYDQELDSVLVGPELPEGRHMFVFEAGAPNPAKIPQTEAADVTVILLTCSFKGQEFIKIGYFVMNEYTEQELKENPPAEPLFDKVLLDAKLGVMVEPSSGKRIQPDDYRVATAPPEAYYIPDFINSIDELYLRRKIDATPQPKWKALVGRRTSCWGGDVEGNVLILDKDGIPDWLKRPISLVCSKTEAFPPGIYPNHVLVNEYDSGHGIMAHVDGPAYFPAAAILSLGSHCIMKFYRDVSNVTLERQFIGSMFLQPRSLLLLKGDMYKKYLHGIDDTFMDILKPGTIFNFDLCPDIEADQKLVRGKRVALTFRNVPRISRILVDTLVVPPLTPRSRKKRIAQEFGRTSTPSSDSSVGSNK